MTRAQSQAATRQSLLAAARTLFGAHGYEDVTIRMITNRAGTSSISALFSYWTGKDALFREAMGRRPINDSMGLAFIDTLRAIERDPNPRTLAAAVVRAYEVGQ